MELPNRRISKETAKEIKAMLWEGQDSQKEIGRIFGVTGASISNIFRGYQHADVRWPDGSRGGISVERYEHLNWLRGMSRWERTDKYKAERKYSPETIRASTMVEEVHRRIDAGESIDDIKFDDAGNLIPKKSETP